MNLVLILGISIASISQLSLASVGGAAISVSRAAKISELKRLPPKSTVLDLGQEGHGGDTIALEWSVISKTLLNVSPDSTMPGRWKSLDVSVEKLTAVSAEIEVRSETHQGATPFLMAPESGKLIASVNPAWWATLKSDTKQDFIASVLLRQAKGVSLQFNEIWNPIYFFRKTTDYLRITSPEKAFIADMDRLRHQVLVVSYPEVRIQGVSKTAGSIPEKKMVVISSRSWNEADLSTLVGITDHEWRMLTKRPDDRYEQSTPALVDFRSPKLLF